MRNGWIMDVVAFPLLRLQEKNLKLFTNKKEFSVKIVYFMKKKYTNNLVLKIFIKLVLFSYKWISTCKTVVGKYGFKINFKLVFINYGFKNLS